MTTKNSIRNGFTLIEIMIVLAIIGLLAAIAIPNFIRAREASQKNACVANLKRIKDAKQAWALENKKLAVDEPTDTDLFAPAKYIKEKPECPAAGTYVLGAYYLKPTCTIPGHTI